MADQERLGAHAKKRKRQGNESDETMKRPSVPGSYRNRRRAIARGRQRESRGETEHLRVDNSGEDFSAVLPHGSRSTERDTLGRGDAHMQEDVEREPPSKKQKSTDEGTDESSTTPPAVLLTPPTAAAPSANATERTRFSRFGALLLGIEQATGRRTAPSTPPPVIISAPRRFFKQMMNMLPSISQTIGWVAVQGTKGMIWVIERVGPVVLFAAAGGIVFAVDLVKSFDGSEAHEAIIRQMGRLFDLFYDDGEDDEEEEEDTTTAPSEPKRISDTTASPQPAKCTCGEAGSPSNNAERCGIHSSTFTGPQQQEQNEHTSTILPAAHISRREPVPVRVTVSRSSSATHQEQRESQTSGVLSVLAQYCLSQWPNGHSVSAVHNQELPEPCTFPADTIPAQRPPSCSLANILATNSGVNGRANFSNNLYPIRPQLPPPHQTISVYSAQTPMNQPPQNSGAYVLYAYHNDPNAWDPSGLIMGLDHGPLPPPPSVPQTMQLGPPHFVDFNGHRFVFEWETPASRDLVDFLAQAEREFRNSLPSGFFDRQRCVDLFNGKIRDLIYAGENLAGYPRVAAFPLLGGVVEQSGGTV
ncbi:hypothetical protein D0860_01107 [Hortaea werneckii]|uniref:Uncharacterized protein n=1 Tax=Hortaea werneckii TaxID=91943 RepID=A0A3M7HTD9_HORWE|nr:hypothetical protein D0860_01107 [Hortaea werneckii]RMZ33020.1 hypothetical protein D0859_02822 [Hortaea werneckii]